METASRHRLMPLLYYQLSSICQDNIPEDILNQFKDYFHENVHKNLLLTGELIKILNLFKSHGIKAIPYKGPVLASSAYGNLGLRVFDDLDIFIPEHHILKVKDLITSNGYEIQSNNVNDSKYIKSQREYTFFNVDSNLMLEVKWKLPGIPFSFSDDIGCLYDPESLERVEISNSHVLSFSPEDLLLILCIHNAGHRWQYLQWVCDIAELVRKHENMNWAKIIDKSERLGVRRILFINLLLASDLLGIKVPKEISGDMNTDNHANKITMSLKDNFFYRNLEEQGLLDYSLFHIEMREKLKNGLLDFVLHVIAPSKEDLEELTLPNYLFPLYYIFRPILLLKRYSLGIFKSNRL